MAVAYATGDYTLQAIADAFGVHYSTVSRAVSGTQCYIARFDPFSFFDLPARTCLTHRRRYDLSSLLELG